ncbi:MAG: methyltransferase domain-containing protein [Kofleriaceae bacterium]|nr:methyltransferase domain-containing protein [Kofleriaceae bacterium]MCB9574829.1 methyltransferase domain-containing protein [Kofleriaceae bacterium]
MTAASIDDASHYRWLAAAYCRGALRDDGLGDDDAALAAGVAAGLRLHRFKRTAGLPRVRRVLGILRGLGVAALVDVGTGRGAFLWPLLDELVALDVLALDVLPHRVEGLAAVRRGGVARLAAARMDATALGLADGAADAVTLLEVLEHLVDPAPAMAEAVRVARRAVVVTVPSHADDNPEHLHLFTAATLEAGLRAAGARRVTIDGVHGHLVAVALR